ncbi:MAG: tRNA 2-thiouridine(34) synthase MnmA [Clostridia bacterium]|nr:tRNA 2-thiouridine(34) synthase MnmA [Clostridia bacterium]
MKALIALSGGVDSACAAIMMKNQGYDCIGVTMKLHAKNESSCLTSKDIEDARGVCENLKIPYTVVDFSSDFDKYVIENFISAYENGATPNPCIECNFRLKFDKLYEYGMEQGCDFIVTGHYARIEYDEKYGRRVLKRGVDAKKDQSYVLWRISREKLEKTVFPLGNIESKDEAREMASKAGLDVSGKKDSQDICFIPDGDYASFIESYRKKSYPHGDFVDLQGKILGKHKGIIRYTIGQRKGLGLALPASMYVVAKDLEKNQVVLGFNEDLLSKELYATDVNLSAIDSIDTPLKVKAKIRYNQEAKDAYATMENGLLHIVFDEPQRAVCRGQSVVIYDDDTVLGGGIIC